MIDQSKLTYKDFIVSKLGETKFTLPETDSKVKYISEDDKIIVTRHYKFLKKCCDHNQKIPLLELAGPREKIFFNPQKTIIGIVTCGGLCPGLNSIIRAVVLTAKQFYGVKKVYGFRNGYEGLNPKYQHQPLDLTEDVVDEIYTLGGTILGSSRGPQPTKVIVDYLDSLKVNILITVGGDGTLRGADDIQTEIAKRGLPISVIGIPKTIDNDIPFIERSFGFETAVQEAAKAINSAHVEAKSAPNGIGIVKLMGRDSGFIAATATLASPVVNFCLVPEVPFKLDGPRGLLKVLEKRMAIKKHAVIVVAEGAGQYLLGNKSAEKDKSGNIRFFDIGLYLKDEIKKYFKQKKKEVNIKYIDPSYLIRSVAPTGDDNVFCTMLGQSAVHAGMCGYTSVIAGFRNDHYVLIPIKLVKGRKNLSPDGRLWVTVIETTRQPALML